MSKRFDRFALSLTLAVFAPACSSNADAPLVQEPAGITTPADAGANLYAQPAPTATAPPPVNDYDAGPVLTVDSGTPVATVDAGPIACPAGGEIEVEPNESASPNALNGIRCGVLTPGDTDVLVVSRTAFDISWVGAVNIVPSQPVAGGAYHLTITSQTPSVNTYWQVTLK
jgi:hypothetical protein